MKVLVRIFSMQYKPRIKLQKVKRNFTSFNRCRKHLTFEHKQSDTQACPRERGTKKSEMLIVKVT